MMIHQQTAEELLKQFSPEEAIDQVYISCAESGDTTTSDPKVEELLWNLQEAQLIAENCPSLA